MKLAWSKNKKGAALVYAIMVLLLLATVIVALTALSTASYTDAVLAASDDQSYFYAKSIGLAVKEQFKDGYNIARILASLDEQEADSSISDPKVTGTFTIANKDGDLVTGSLQIRYARDEYDNVNTNVIEVRSACVVNNAVAAVTSVFSCEDDSEDESNHLQDSLTDYDVVLTDVNNLNFDFTQASEGVSGTSNLSVYVYAGEDDNVTVPDFDLHLDLAGKLTTTGKVIIASKQKGSNNYAYHKITGNLTCYGDVGLVYTGVNGSNGIHCDGNVVLGLCSYVKNNIYARGAVAIADQPGQLNLSYVSSNADSTGGGLTKQGENSDGLHSAKNIYAQGGVSVGKMAWVTGSIYTHGDVVVAGKGANAGNPFGTNPLSDHMGNTLVEGSIYSEGNVTVQNGAIVGGNIYANGNVIIGYGATVVGNVQSVNGNVYVYSSVVGGQVNCPKGTLELNNYGQDSYCAYLAEYDFDPMGRVVFGGIGIYQYGKIYKHTCYNLKTTDCNCMSIINGNIYVENPTYANGGTPLLSVWARDGVFLKNSFAYFAQENGLRAYVGKNEAGNPYTYVAELNQNKDLYDPAQQYINMYGAHVITLNVGANKDALYDAYLWNGWVNNINARCMLLADMQVDSYAYASQFMYLWGTGTAVANYAATPAYHRNDAAAYTYARSDTNGYTYIPLNPYDSNVPTLEVACKMPAYSGINSEDTRCGFGMGGYADVRCKVKVGSDEADLVNSFVILGDEASSGPTKFFGELYAYTATVQITASTRLSPVKSGNPNGATGRIYAEVGNLFYVEPSTSAGQYRWGSTIQVKGNAQVDGWVYNFDHFEGNFSNANTARIQGTFKTTASGNITLQGASCFSGEIQATNANSVFSLSGPLTVAGLRLNGKLKFTSASYKLKVNGDAFIKNVSSQIIAPVEITGNLTINTSDQSVLKPQKAFSVGGDLYLGQKSIELSASSHVVTGRVEAANGDITVKGGASIGGAKTAANKTLTVDGGTLAGDFIVGNFTFVSGTVCPASGRITGKVSGVYTHSGGTITNSDIKVTYSSSSTAAVAISGTAKAESVFINANSGFATVTGGSNVDYKYGALRTYYTTTIQGGFQCGISVSYGDLQIGSTSPTSDVYKVGTIIQSGDPDNDAYCVVYAKGNVNWGYGARAPYDGRPQNNCDITRVTAGGNVVLGRSDYYVSGMFSGIYSANGYVNLYVEKVDGVYAKNTSWVHTSGFLGYLKNSQGSGAKITNGDLYVYGLTGNEYLRGHNEVSGVFHLEQAINAEGCLIKCRDITGLANFKKSDDCAPISLHLTAPTKGSDGYYELTTGIEGAFTIKNSNLKYSSPVKVKGELYVDGILMYNGSTENVQCLGGLYCKNAKVNITSDFRGNVQLPNVTTLVLNADIGINAPKVTSFELHTSVSHSVSLTSCDSITVASGITVGGSIKIKNTGIVTNNGRIAESVECGIYEGSGSVGGNVVTLKGDSTSTISGSGYVTGNIWASGNLTINSSGTFGKSGSYIYSKKNITITNATFHSSMNYILSTGGDIELNNCRSIPKVWNNSGSIVFKNDSSYATNIASVLSYGKHVYFGTTSSNNYQTVTGDVEWYGSDTNVSYAVEFWGNKHTTVNGKMLLFGTGNVHTSNAKFEGPVHFRNSGTIDASSGGAFNGASVSIGYNTKNYTSTANINATIGGNLLIWGSSSANVTLGASVSGYIHMHVGNSLTINGTVAGDLNAASVKNVYLNKALSGTCVVSYGTLTTKENDGTIGKNLRAYDANLYVNANVGGNVTHTAHNISDSYPMKVVALGNQKKMITVNGNILVHGRLVDNSKQLGAGRTINCKGAYYADLQKEFNDGSSENGKGCTQFNFTGEADGRCYILGARGGNYTVYNTVFNIDGHLSIYTFYNEADAKYYQMTFNKSVTCGSLIVNSNCPNTNSTTATVGGAPTKKIGFYGKSDNTAKAKGIDKKCWFENFESYKYLDIYYTNDTYSGACTQSDRMYFKGAVNVKGVCIASHTKFGNQLKTEGQTSLAYCLLYSAGYSSDTNHCTTSSNGNGIRVADDGVFLHTSSSFGGENYFNHVNTYSNVSVYNGASHVFGGSIFKGTVYGGSNDERSYTGHSSTKLFYFGDSLEIYGSSAITSAAQADVDLAAGRTIVWVNKGALVVRDKSYIGCGLYRFGESCVRNFDGSKKDGVSLNTNRQSQHPGVFVSDTSSGTVTISGTSYNKGSVNVIGTDSNNPSTITLDICAYREFNVKNYGSIAGKDKSSSDWRYYAGFYVTKGSFNQSNNGKFGFLNISDAIRGDDHYWTGEGDATAYVPNGSRYLYYFGYEWHNKNGATGSWNNKRYNAQTQAQLTQCYTPNSTAPTVASPTAIPAANMTNSQGISVTDSVIVTETSKQSAPDQPTISAGESSGSSGFNTNGDASVNPLEVSNANAPDGPCTAVIDEAEISIAKVTAPSTGLTFNSGRANASTILWTSPNYSPSGTGVTHASSAWTSSITRHFDKTVKEYWNTRYIPYVWKLPYYDSNNTATPAKRLLKGKTFEWENDKKNGDFQLTSWTEAEATGSDYYVNSAHYSGSTLQTNVASKIRGWRTNGVSSGGQLWDWIGLNGCDPDYWLYPDDVKRRSKLLIFESGELPFEAFYMNTSDDRCGNLGVSKTIRGSNQIGWWMGSDEVSYYDVSLIFYTCADPANPFGSAAKDLHVVLPQGIAARFYYDANNTVTVLGNGRVFLYLTSGDTLYFKANAVSESSSGILWWQNTSYKSIYANPVGGLKKINSTTYEPLLYIIGAGTNIDLIVEDMPLSAVVYMPFGSDGRLYNASSGSLKQYNNFKSLVTGKTFSSLYSGTGATTAVNRNRLQLVWNDGKNVGLPRWTYGPIVTDNFLYTSAASAYNLSFKNEYVKPNLSDTTIYDYSTTGNNMRGGKTYSIATFLSNAPGYSTSLLNWEYKRIKVEG